MKPKCKLVVQSGEDEGTEYPLDAEVLRLGREKARTIPLEDGLVSRKHAEITCIDEDENDPHYGENWVILDLDSTNGTFVNEDRVSGSHSLRIGDLVRVGKTVFRTEEIDSGRQFRNILAILITLTTLAAAMVAWRSSNASDNAGSADGKGIGMVIDYTRSQNDINASLEQNKTAFASYNWQRMMAEQIAARMQQTDDKDQLAALEKERIRYANLAAISLQMLNSDYIKRDGDMAKDESFDSKLYVEASMAEAQSKQDMDYQPHFKEADVERKIVRYLSLTSIFLSLATFCFTGATITRTSFKYFAAAGGVFFSVMGIISVIVVEALGR